MPIQINLLTDALAEEELRKKDPVKRAVFFGALVVALMLVWFSSNLLQHVVAGNNLAQVQSEIQTHTNDYNVAIANLQNLHAGENRLQALNNLTSARFLQGNLMNALQQLYVSNVNLMRIEVAQRYTPSGPDAKPASVTESTVLTLDARDSSPSPGEQVNHYKDAINHLDYFKSLLAPVDGVKLSNLSPPQGAPGGSSFVLFTIACRLNDQTR